MNKRELAIEMQPKFYVLKEKYDVPLTIRGIQKSIDIIEEYITKCVVNGVEVNLKGLGKFRRIESVSRGINISKYCPSVKDKSKVKDIEIKPKPMYRVSFKPSEGIRNKLKEVPVEKTLDK